jgi:hypothetical protein
MNITTTSRPYALNASKQAHFEALHELTRLQSLPDLNAQDSACRTTIQIGETPTHWSKGLNADIPPFLQHTVNGIKRIHVIDVESMTVGVYDRTAPKAWERRALLQAPLEILASLPKKALQDAPANRPATPKQVETIRKLLEFPSDRPLPEISVMAASRILDRILLKSKAIELYSDLKMAIATQAQKAA